MKLIQNAKKFIWIIKYMKEKQKGKREVYIYEIAKRESLENLQGMTLLRGFVGSTRKLEQEIPKEGAIGAVEKEFCTENAGVEKRNSLRHFFEQTNSPFAD